MPGSQIIQMGTGDKLTSNLSPYLNYYSVQVAAKPPTHSSRQSFCLGTFSHFGQSKDRAPGRPDGRGCRGRTRHPLAAIRTVMDDLRPALCEYCSPLRPIKTPRYFCASLCVQESSARAPNLHGGCNSWRGVLNSTRDSRLARSRLCTSGRRPCINTLPLALRRGQECSQAASFNP